MNRNLLSTLVLGLLVMAATAWYLHPDRRGPQNLDPAKTKYIHCPDCERENKFNPAVLNPRCPICNKVMVGTERSIKETGSAPNPNGKMFSWMYAELVVVMGIVLLVIRRKRETAAENDDYFYTNCPKCEQKYRYREHQAGLEAKCRRCKRTFTYPDVSQVRS